MDSSLIPSNRPKNKGDEHASNQDARAKGSGDPPKEVTPLDGYNEVKTDSIWIPLGVIDAGITLLFWGYSEFFGSHNAPILSNFCFFIFIASVLAGLAGYIYKHWPFKVLICASYVAACGISGFIIYEYSRLQAEIVTNIVEWQPPQLLAKESVGFLKLGGWQNWGIAIPEDFQKTSNSLSIPTIMPGSSNPVPVSIILTNNRLYINVSVPETTGSGTVTICGIGVNAINDVVVGTGYFPMFWDLNFSQNAIEIVDENYLPILQIIYIRPDQITVKGYLAKDGHYLLLGEKTNFFAPLPIDKSRDDLRQLFKYPSSLHKGEYAK